MGKITDLSQLRRQCPPRPTSRPQSPSRWLKSGIHRGRPMRHSESRCPGPDEAAVRPRHLLDRRLYRSRRGGPANSRAGAATTGAVMPLEPNAVARRPTFETYVGPLVNRWRLARHDRPPSGRCGVRAESARCQCQDRANAIAATKARTTVGPMTRTAGAMSLLGDQGGRTLVPFIVIADGSHGWPLNNERNERRQGQHQRQRDANGGL